jgi:hypothetical protein
MLTTIITLVCSILIIMKYTYLANSLHLHQTNLHFAPTPCDSGSANYGPKHFSCYYLIHHHYFQLIIATHLL